MTAAALPDRTAIVQRGQRLTWATIAYNSIEAVISIVAGLLAASQGTVRLDGNDPARLPAARLARRAGYVFQDPAVQFLSSRVGDELRVGLRTSAERARADDLLAALDLARPDLADASPYTLSGGEQRRLSVACALVRDPAILVLDEPTYGQDRAHFEVLVRLLRERVAAGTALLAATHDLLFAGEVTGRAIGLRAGRIDFDGPTAALLSDGARRAELALT